VLGQADLARAREAHAAADESGHRHVLVRAPKGPVAYESGSLTEEARDRVDPSDLERLLGRQGGRIPGSLWASIVLPDPGGPTSSRLWPPAALTSSARLAVGCPLTSLRSLDHEGTAPSLASTGGGTHLPVSQPKQSAMEEAATTSSPSIRTASSALPRGHRIPFRPAARHAIAATTEAASTAHDLIPSREDVVSGLWVLAIISLPLKGWP
jgi:hypothetical protein